MVQFVPDPFSTSKLSEEERRERRRAASRLNMESRRRAVTRLIDRYPEEYDALYKEANLQLRQDPKYRN